MDNAKQSSVPGNDIAAMTTQYLSHELILSTSPLKFTLRNGTNYFDICSNKLT